MAFFVYNKRDGHAVGPYETAQSFTADEERDVVIEMEIDFSTDYLPCFKLSEDGLSLVNPHAGKTIEEQKQAVEEEEEVAEIANVKNIKKQFIRSIAKERLEDLEWKLDKAKDLDRVNGNNNALTAYYNERNAIRIANNAHEDALYALTDLQAVKDFNPGDF